MPQSHNWNLLVLCVAPSTKLCSALPALEYSHCQIFLPSTLYVQGNMWTAVIRVCIIGKQPHAYKLLTITTPFYLNELNFKGLGNSSFHYCIGYFLYVYTLFWSQDTIIFHSNKATEYITVKKILQRPLGVFASW